MACSYIAGFLLATTLGRLSYARPTSISQTEDDGKHLFPIRPLQLIIAAYGSISILPRRLSSEAVNAITKQEEFLTIARFSNTTSLEACRDLCYKEEQLDCLGGYYQPIHEANCMLGIMKKEVIGAETTEQCPLGVNPEALSYIDDMPHAVFQGPCHKSDEERKVSPRMLIAGDKDHPILPRQIADFALESMANQDHHLTYVHSSNVTSEEACRELCYQREQLNCFGGFYRPFLSGIGSCSLGITKEKVKDAKTTKQCPLGVNPEPFFYVDDTAYFLFQGPCHKSDKENKHPAHRPIGRRSGPSPANLYFDKMESKDECRKLCFKTRNCLRAIHSQKTAVYGIDKQVGKCTLIITPEPIKGAPKRQDCPFGTLETPDEVARYGYYDHDGAVVYTYDGPCHVRRAWGVNLHFTNVSGAGACRDLCYRADQPNCLGGRWSMGHPPLAPANGTCALVIDHRSLLQSHINDFSNAPVTDQCPHGKLQLHAANVVDDSKDGPMGFSFVGPCYDIKNWNIPDLTRDLVPLWMAYGDGRVGLGTPTSCIEDGIPCPGNNFIT